MEQCVEIWTTDTGASGRDCRTCTDRTCIEKAEVGFISGLRSRSRQRECPVSDRFGSSRVESVTFRRRSVVGRPAPKTLHLDPGTWGYLEIPSYHRSPIVSKRGVTLTQIG